VEIRLALTGPKNKRFGCERWDSESGNPSDHVKWCWVEGEARLERHHFGSDVGGWLVCFGEIEWKQLYEGELSSHRTGWVEAIHRSHAWESPLGDRIRVQSNVAFPRGYKVLDPQPLWAECRMRDRLEIGREDDWRGR
jgi:hypothetical protein